MTEEFKIIINRELGKLPKEKQEAIQSLDWQKATEEIAKKHYFTEGEVYVLQVEVFLVLVGINDFYSLAINIEDDISTSEKEAQEIVTALYQRIFVPINEIFAEKIQSSEKIKAAGLEENLDFILSGGDYSAFIQAKEDNNK